MQAEALPQIKARAVSLPWRPLVALVLALAAQIALEPHLNQGWTSWAFLYLWVTGLVIWSSVRGEWTMVPIPKEIHKVRMDEIRLGDLIVSAPLALIAFLAFGGKVFDTMNVTLWALAHGALFAGLWAGIPQISRW